MDDFTLDLADEAATIALGAALAQVMEPNLTIYLHGNLGAGKTTLVRGLLQGLDYQGKVKSPTYTIVEPYEVNRASQGAMNIYHFDLYRFNDEEEWESAGFRDYFNAQSICLIEWPERAAHLLPIPDIDVYILMQGVGRSVRITLHSQHARQCMQRLKQPY